MLLQYAFKDCHEGVYIHTRTGGKLFNIARLRAKTKVTEVLIREMLFADDAALTSHTVDGLQQACQSLLLRLQGVWTDYQPGKNQHHGPGKRLPSNRRH